MLPMPTQPTSPIPERPILVVDDDAKIVRLVRTYLERDGFSVVTAADGPAALDAIERHRPALVVLDLMLPELDGRAVIRAVRRDDAAAATPILVLSARGSTIDRIAGFEDGADDYLPKPFSPAELVLRVKSILRRAATTPTDDPTRAPVTLRRPGHRRRPVRGHPRRPADPADAGRVPAADDAHRGGRTGPHPRPAARRGLRPGPIRSARPDRGRPHRPAARQARRRRRATALRRDRPRHRLSGGPDMIGRGIATRIALAALVSAAVGLAILAVGVTVVGADVFRSLMAEAGISADHAQDMYDRSVTTVVDRRGRGGGHRQRVARGRPRTDARAATRRGRCRRPPDRRRRLCGARPARGPGGDRQPRRIRSTRWPPACNARR